MTGNVQNAGTLDLGSAVGTLTITGNYTQTPAGALTIKLGGVTAGTLYDQLVVSGAAQLGGTLKLVPAVGFQPAGHAFTVVTYGSETHTTLVIVGGQSYAAVYGGAGLVVTAS